LSDELAEKAQRLMDLAEAPDLTRQQRDELLERAYGVLSSAPTRTLPVRFALDRFQKLYGL
jgi:hypothetical protein